MLYLTSFYCMLHTDNVHLFDDNEHKPIVGSCGHAICLECFQSQETPSCPICQKENAFDQAKPNYAAIGLIKQCREDFWSTLKMWWSGENYGEGLCSKCVKIEQLRICLTCHQKELCDPHEQELRLRMRSEVDLINLACHAICCDCFLEDHAKEGHRSVRIDYIKHSKKDIKMTTAKIILKLFRDGMRKKKGLIDCRLRHEKVENTGFRLLKLLGQLHYTEEGECGNLEELIKIELIKKYIDDIDKKHMELFKKDHEENPICECTHLYEKIEQLGSTEGSYTYSNMTDGTIERCTPGCPLYFKSHLKSRLELYNMIGEARGLEVDFLKLNACSRRQKKSHHSEHNYISEGYYRENWVDIIETFWKSEMPPLENYCIRCLEEFNDFGISYSCEKLNMRKRVEEGIEALIKYFKLGDIRLRNPSRQRNGTFEHRDCLMKDRSFWKYEIISRVVGDIRRIMDDGIRNTVWNCQLRKVRMKQLTKNLHFSMCNLKLRKYDRRSFCAKIAKVDTLLECIKTQWNTHQNSAQFEPQCKCTVIWEHNRKMLKENRLGDFDARQKRYDLQRKMVRIAKCSLEQDIGGCPMDLDHGIVLDALVVEGLKKCSFADFVETLENMDTSSGTTENFD